MIIKIFDFDQDLKKWKTKFKPENYKRPKKVLRNEIIDFTNGKKDNR